MPNLHFRLSKNDDPEERLEEAALWKAMHDEYRDDIKPLPENDNGPVEGHVFGRQLRVEFKSGNPVSDYLPYWEDRAFLDNAVREFSVCSIGDVPARVAALHERGLGAFIKSTRSKHAIFKVSVGVDPMKEIDAMVFSFIDGGPELMVQELCDVTYEYRFMCIDRSIITGSPIMWALTPIDYPLPDAALYRTPKDTEQVADWEIYASLFSVARRVAETMSYPHASIDCAMINGKPGVVEFNPMRLGQLGLYASDVRALAAASRKLLPTASSSAG